ncbi:MAG: hypothetical protein QOD65_1869 [Gaiellales bacterium]|jgi:hypothetical protein|nr:hypothetical protein [Gaiellales bacterium]MEA2171274.1 hypothetical protein [Solirubrobacteraceae bacterium]
MNPALHVLGALSGVGLAVATEKGIAATAPEHRLLSWTIALPVAAAIYPAARRSGHLRREGVIEFAALALYGAFASRIPGRGRNRALAAGWASHAAFDALHHSGPDSRIPGWYPAACAGYDLVAAGMIAGVIGASPAPGRPT